VSQQLTRWRSESTDHAPGRLLLLDAQNGRAFGIGFERKMKIGHALTDEQPR